jgi:hypothetical protein
MAPGAGARWSADRPLARMTGGGRLSPSMHEVRPGLWLGSYGAACDGKALAERRITHVLSVGLHVDSLGSRCRLRVAPTEDEPLTRFFIAVQDVSSARLDRHFEVCSGFIAEALDQGGAILVHCQAGQSRSPSVVAAYLMRKERLTAECALNSIRRVRSVICPNPGFVDQLQALQLRLGIQEGDSDDEEDKSDAEEEGALKACDIKFELGIDVAPEVAQAPDLFGLEESRLRYEKLRARCLTLKTSPGLLSFAAPLRKRRHK